MTLFFRIITWWTRFLHFRFSPSCRCWWLWGTPCSFCFLSLQIFYLFFAFFNFCQSQSFLLLLLFFFFSHILMELLFIIVYIFSGSTWPLTNLSNVLNRFIFFSLLFLFINFLLGIPVFEGDLLDNFRDKLRFRLFFLR